MSQSEAVQIGGLRVITPAPRPAAAPDIPPRRGLAAFDELESEVRSYCRAFPTVFASASGAVLRDEDGREYLDFFAGAGTLNYGHNPRFLKERVAEYLARDGVLHGLDMATVAKREFLERFDAVILRPRGMEGYRVQFPGPTGTNAVEAALKLARKVTGRKTVAFFANGYHGMTLGALAVTGNAAKRRGAGVPLHDTVSLPFDGDLGPGVDSLDVFAAMLGNSGSGVEVPAAVIVETVQAEGGIKVASAAWLRRLEALCRKHGVLLIADDIQVGCGRTGAFFSFEEAGIRPDLVCLSKSISGIGLPMALVLIGPGLDAWSPGEHNGTFRGNNLAFVTATAALGCWVRDGLTREVARKAARLTERLQAMADAHPAAGGTVRGRGFIQGIAFADPELAGRVSQGAFARGVVVETAGPRDEVLKILPPLTISDGQLEQGLDRIAEALDEAMAPEFTDEPITAAIVEAAWA
ncbi:MAG: diaminobutyrate--2-oxoglutarate transaminase [Longimicrobiaceae bacterium]